MMEINQKHMGYRIPYRFASREEGVRLKMGNTAYFEAQTPREIAWKLERPDASSAYFKAIAEAQIREFTPDEKKAVDAAMDFIEERLSTLGIRLPFHEEIIFIKSDMKDEGHAAGYTQKNQIYLGSLCLERTARAFLKDPEYRADYAEFRLFIFRELVSHELFHCLTRGDASFRRRMYALIGFSVQDQDIEFGPSVREAILHNPDVERYDDSAEFTIGGRKRRCILLATLSQSYAEAVTENCCANFFDYAQAALVPLDQPDTMIQLVDATDFYDVVGRNTDYVLSSEECLAENFSALVTYGTEGRYDSMDKTVTPYETPQLIMEMHDTLRRHYYAELSDMEADQSTLLHWR